MLFFLSESACFSNSIKQTESHENWWTDGAWTKEEIIKLHCRLMLLSFKLQSGALTLAKDLHAFLVC